jgi:hypothetical protein
MPIKLFLLLSVLLSLLAAGCSDPQPPTINLYRAVHIGDIDQIERNLFWGAEVNQPGPDGLTALHVATRKGGLVVVEMLLESGADIEALNGEGHSPLATALLARNTLVAEYLVEQGAQIDPDALLQLTVQAGQADRDVVDFLAKQGADLDAIDAAGNAPLHLAILGGHRVIAKYLVQKGAAIDIPDAAGRTPLQLAIEQDEQAIAQMLRKFGASISP